MGSSGSASVYDLKKFKRNYLRNKEDFDRKLSDITDMDYEELFEEIFKDSSNYCSLFNKRFVLVGNTYNNREIMEVTIFLDEVDCEVTNITIY